MVSALNGNPVTVMATAARPEELMRLMRQNSPDKILVKIGNPMN
jgi:hypothetical protein